MIDWISNIDREIFASLSSFFGVCAEYPLFAMGVVNALLALGVWVILARHQRNAKPD